MNDRKKYYVEARRGPVSSVMHNAYPEWVYEKSVNGDILSCCIDLDGDYKIPDVMEKIVKYLETYDEVSVERRAHAYSLKTVIKKVDCYAEKKGERIYISIEKYSGGIRLCMAASGSLGDEAVKDLRSIFKIKKEEEGNKNHISIIIRRFDMLEAIPLPLEIKGNEIEKTNYDSSVIESYGDIVKQFSLPEPSGRLLLLKGLPGTGKTYFVRNIIRDVYGDKIFIPSNMAGDLSGPELFRVLLNEPPAYYSKDKYKKKPKILIFEDAELLVMKRRFDNSSFVSNMLNFADGLIGSLTNTFVIVTTNIIDDFDIDPAVLRPGRLMKLIEFPPLGPEKANSLFRKLTGSAGSFNAPVTLARVYSLARGGGEPDAGIVHRRSVGFTAAGEMGHIKDLLQ